MSDHMFIKARQAAQDLISDYRIVDPGKIPLEHLALDLGIFVKAGTLWGATATLTCNQYRGVVTVDKNITHLGKKRFAIAHELGHFKLHSKEKAAYFCTEKMFLQWYKNSNRELEANAFAVELLMPEDIFKNFLANRSPSRELLFECADKFQTSLTATYARYAEVGPYPCILFVSVDGKVRWIKESCDMSKYFRIQIGSELSEFSCAGDYFHNEKEETEPQRVRFDAWFNDYNMNHNTVVYEYPIYLKRYNTVLSLVWLN